MNIFGNATGDPVEQDKRVAADTVAAIAQGLKMLLLQQKSECAKQVQELEDASERNLLAKCVPAIPSAFPGSRGHL